MKKMLSMLMLGFFLLLFLFSGCSEKAEMPYETNGVDNYVEKIKLDVLSVLIEDICETNYFSLYKVENRVYINALSVDWENQNLFQYKKFYPQLTHYLEILIYFAKNDYFEFSSMKMKNAFINKVNVVLKMVNNEKYRIAYNKIENDLKNFIGFIENDFQYYVALVKLELTQIMLKDPDLEYYAIALLPVIIWAAKTSIIDSSVRVLSCESCKYNWLVFASVNDWSYEEMWEEINKHCYCKNCPCDY